MRRWIVLVLFLSVSSVARADSVTVLFDEGGYPPFAYTDSSEELKGISMDLLKVLFEKAGIEYEIQRMSWPKAYSTLLKKPNTFSPAIHRSKARQDKFEWVGDVLVETIYLYQNRGRKSIVVETIEDASKYRVGGVKKWDTTRWLSEQGVAILELEQNWTGLKLMSLEKLDLMSFTELNLAYESASHGLDPSVFMKTIKIRDTPLAFAMSKGSDPAVLAKLRKTFKKIRNNGVYQRIHDQYVYMDLYDKPTADLLRKQ